MKKLCFAIVALFALSLNAADIEGTYNVTGYDPYEKKSYTGTVEITKTTKNIYQASWTLDLDPPEYRGTGLMNKDQINFIYQSSAPRIGGKVGLQNYTIKKNKLEGTFVYFNGDLVGTETLTKQ